MKHKGQNIDEASNVKISLEDDTRRFGSFSRDRLCLCANVLGWSDGHAWTDASRRDDEPNAQSDDARPNRHAFRDERWNARGHERPRPNAWPAVRRADYARTGCVRRYPGDRSGTAIRSQNRLVEGEHRGIEATSDRYERGDAACRGYT